MHAAFSNGVHAALEVAAPPGWLWAPGRLWRYLVALADTRRITAHWFGKALIVIHVGLIVLACVSSSVDVGVRSSAAEVSKRRGKP